MSRKGKSTASKKAVNGPPPSYPAETYREHRKFLIRSLERNDVDINALIELNKSLQKAKETILKSCGEGILLDLGSGRLKLINDELYEENPANTGVTPKGNNGKSIGAETTTHQFYKPNHLTSTQKKVCVDFLLRMKLRRKLCNRLVRRLTRLAHAMDGKDVSPPFPPKYGDVRFQIDKTSIESQQIEWKKKDDARKRIQRAVDSNLLDSTKLVNINEEKERSDDLNGTSSEIAKIKDPPDETRSTENPDQKPTDSSSMVEVEEKPMDGRKGVVGQSQGGKNDYLSPKFLEDFELLKEYEYTYDKIWNATTKSFNYVVANEEYHVPEYEKLTNAVGVGASSVFTSLESLQTEYKRWQTNMMRKIQKQPTSEELGLKDRVFLLKERRKRCLEKMEEEGSVEGENSIRKKAKSEGKDNKIGDNEIELTSTNESVTGGNDENIESDEDEKREENDVISDALKLKKSISFAATPSFHDQDLARIRMIHRDILNSSQAELTRKRLTDATNEYNQTLQSSTQLLDARQLIQQKLSFTIAKGRQELTKAHGDYTIAYTTAKQLWLKDKFEYDMKKSQAVLPSKWGSQPLGTEMINRYMQNNRSNIKLVTVSRTLADIVDGSILAAEGKAPIQRFKDFVPPPAPGMNVQTGENMAQRQHRIETEYRKQYTSIDANFQKSEAERTRAWRKVMKAQAEINAISGTNGKGVRITMGNYHHIPVPALRASAQPNIQRQYVHQSAKLPYSTPPVSTNPTTFTDMSKYSAAKVKQRKSADGTVAPVSVPKKTKDGLYLRPAGRTRKGMEWDAVNGVWVPQRS